MSNPRGGWNGGGALKDTVRVVASFRVRLK